MLTSAKDELETIDKESRSRQYRRSYGSSASGLNAGGNMKSGGGSFAPGEVRWQEAHAHSKDETVQLLILMVPRLSMK